MPEQQPEVVEAPVLTFFSDHSDKTFATLDELKAYLKDEKPSIEKMNRADFPNLKFDKDANNCVTMDWGKGPVKVRDTGFTRLCKLVKAPESFLATLPLDNIRRDIVARLLSTDELQSVSLILKDGMVVGASKKEEPLLANDLLASCQFFNTNHKTYRQIGVNNGRIVVDLTTSENSPLPADSFGFGVSLVHDDTQGTYPSIAPYSFRLACLNGAIHKSSFGSYRFSSRMSIDSFYEAFGQKIDEVATQMFNEYASVLNTASTKPIEDDEKPILCEFLSGELNWENGIDGRASFESDISRKGNATYYDLMNFVTSYANQLDIFGRRKVQMLGVEVFDYFKGDRSELFDGYAEFKREYIYNHS